jgi:hypothetical protein
MRILCQRAPSHVRLPPQTFRLTTDGQTTTVVGTSREEHPEGIATYNFEVACTPTSSRHGVVPGRLSWFITLANKRNQKEKMNYRLMCKRPLEKSMRIYLGITLRKLNLLPMTVGAALTNCQHRMVLVIQLNTLKTMSTLGLRTAEWTVNVLLLEAMEACGLLWITTVLGYK